MIVLSVSHDSNTRLTNSINIVVLTHQSIILERSFIFSESVIWINLPWKVKMAENFNRIE